MKTPTIPLYDQEPYMLKTINVATLPLEVKNIRRVAVAEFCVEVAKQRGISSYQFTENIHLPPPLREQIRARFQIPAHGIKIDPEVAKNLVVCNTNQLSGSMLCTLSAFARGRPIGIYSGEVVYRSAVSTDSSDDYEFQVKQSDLLLPPGHTIAISAKSKGGFAGFMQDLVDPVTGFTRDGDVAIANLLALPFITHGIGAVMYIAIDEIPVNRQLGYSYGSPYWNTFSVDKKVKKEFFNNKGEIIPGMLLDEKWAKIRLLKTLINDFKKIDSSASISESLSKAKARLAILLSVVPHEILDALNDEERLTLYQYSPGFEDIPDADHYAKYFPDYDCYDREYLRPEFLRLAKQSTLSALHHVKDLQKASRPLVDREVLNRQCAAACKQATLFYRDKKYAQALKHWAQTEEYHIKLYQHCGVIYFYNRPIPLHPEVVKLYWNMGNAFLNSEEYLNALQNLRLAHHLQQYLDAPALPNKSLDDMKARSTEAFDKLTAKYFGGVGQKIQKKDDIQSKIISRKIIHVVQGEVALLNSKRNPGTDLMTLGLSGCCAVLFIDAEQNIVFAHVDVMTDLSFIKAYAAKMRGKYTVDIIAHADHLDPMGRVVADYMKVILPEIKNSKGNTDIRTTKTGVVLIRPIDREIMLLTPQRAHLAMLSRLNAQQRSIMDLPQDNPFRLDTLEEGGRFDQIRMFERAFESYCNEKKQMPTLVYEDGWTGKFPETSEKVKALLQELIKYPNPKVQQNYLNRIVLDKYKHNISILTQMFPMYVHCLNLEEQQALKSTPKV